MPVMPATGLGGSLHPVLGRVYAARGVCSAADLDTSLERLLPVGTLEGIPAAAELLLEHRARRVLVIGDFDADGATSSALVVRALRACGFAAVDFLVPNRFQFGYGLTPEIVALAATREPSLIVTVDNGISSHAGVATARARGIDVLITDHHLPGARLPDANVIVNPNLAGSRFGSRALAGVGVAFYVMAAVRRRLDAGGLIGAGAPGVAELLDLVALGTVADVVPLDANNRVLVAQGLRRIRAGRCVPVDESWHQGVVGLVASRVKDRVRRPVIAFASADAATLRGSARSVAGIHIRDVLDSIATRQPDLISRFGGHAMAAGLTLERAMLERFARAFDEEVARCAGGAVDADAVETDGELTADEIALETAHALRAGGPWGQAFPEPSFDGIFSIRSARVIGERHLKMWVEVPRSGRTFDAIAFNQLEEGARLALPEGLQQLVYRLEVNEYQGERRLQLLVDHLLTVSSLKSPQRC
jgi:single-stranded DNA-specific DHH superfamily exonuclease